MAESKLHIGKEVWTWKMPSWSYVIIRDPNRMKTAVNPNSILAMWYSMDLKDRPSDPKHSWNGRDGSNITPAMVKVYIERFLLNAAASTK